LRNRRAYGHKDKFWRTPLEVVDKYRKTYRQSLLALAALLHDIGKAPTKRFDKKKIGLDIPWA